MSITIRRDESILVREVNGEVVVLDTATNRIHQLNRTASSIWHLCDAALEPEAMAAALVAEFEIDAATELRDVEETLARLQSMNLLSRA